MLKQQCLNTEVRHLMLTEATARVTTEAVSQLLKHFCLGITTLSNK